MRPPIPLRRRVLYAAIVTAVAVCVCYGASIVHRSDAVYTTVRHVRRGWRGGVYRADPTLGFSPRPSARGSEVVKSVEIPVRIDARGFRVPARDPAPRDPSAPRLLALGCSFTFGAAVTAEDTYPYVVGDTLGWQTTNAGCCSYGLAQMLLLGRRLIPELRPQVLLLQVSQWLPERAVNPYAPSYGGALPSPYFADAPDGGLELQPPPFLPKGVELPVMNALDGGKLAFLFDVGAPLLLSDDRHQLLAKLTMRAPTGRLDRVVDEVYDELGRLARAHDVRVVLVLLGVGALYPRPYVPTVPGALFVDAEAELTAALPDRDDATYQRTYMHWRDGELVDGHPNPAAHAMVARAIVTALRAR